MCCEEENVVVEEETCGDCSSMTDAEKNIVLFALLFLIGIVFVVNNPHGHH